LHLGTKSGSRRILREAEVAVPDGFEDLRDGEDIAQALIDLRGAQPDLRRAVVKLNDGFSGEGNAVFDFTTCSGDVERFVREELPTRLRFEAPTECWERYEEKFQQMSGIVECFVEGSDKRSPSVQFRIDPLGHPSPVSTHDQVLGGPSGQVFMGCTFPADPAYRLEIQELGSRVADVVRQHGVIGRFAVDFVSVPEGDGWRHYGLEINLRKGGTTHPLMVLHYLTDGRYDADSGLFLTPGGQPRFYFASDNVQLAANRGMLPDDLIDIVVDNRLHFHGASIGDSPEAADVLRSRTIALLDATV
jgi:hypothetical protein